MICRNNNTSARGFTLVEILVSISIIIILAAIMIGVAGFVQKNARINDTRATLKAIEGIIEKYETETNTKLCTVVSGGSNIIGGTVYADSSGKVLTSAPNPGDVNPSYVDILSRHPATREMIAKLGNKVKTNTVAGNTITYIVDSWGTPIHFIQQGWTPGTGSTVVPAISGGDYKPAPRMYVRSSGPDLQSNFKTSADPTNNDDIYSYEP